MLDVITPDLCFIAAGNADCSCTDDSYVSYFNSSYEQYLAMCLRLVADCDQFQQEAIQFIVADLIRRNAAMRNEITAGQREASVYIMPLDKSNRWGKAVLALAEAFRVIHSQAKAA
jgi:hypothetical protein